jgi:membrane-associated phospholipid phosphatase
MPMEPTEGLAFSPHSPSKKLQRNTRFLLIIGVAILHIFCWIMVNEINKKLPPSHLNNLSTIFDNWIPYLGWTFTLYYLGLFYMSSWAFFIVWKLTDKKLLRALCIYSAMILTGALLEIAVPARSPYPNDMNSVQQFIHEKSYSGPYACFPSMHVSLTVLPALILFSVIRSKWTRFFSTLIAVLIVVSTLTLKEHFFIDTLAGVIFAFIFYGIWRLDFKKLFCQQKGG